MYGDMDPRVEKLLEFGEKVRPRELIPTLHEEAALFVEENPFAFALAAVLDRGTKAEIIWTIPHYIKKQLGELDPNFFANASIEDIKNIFQNLPVKPRYINDAPHTIKELAQIVVREFDGETRKIWENRDSEFVKRTFQRIYGVGPGISSMIVLLLERCFKVKFNDLDHKNMDIKPDVHTIRVFYRLGFISEPSEDSAVKVARRLNPEYPGALDDLHVIFARPSKQQEEIQRGIRRMIDECPTKLLILMSFATPDPEKIRQGLIEELKTVASHSIIQIPPLTKEKAAIFILDLINHEKFRRSGVSNQFYPYTEQSLKRIIEYIVEKGIDLLPRNIIRCFEHLTDEAQKERKEIIDIQFVDKFFNEKCSSDYCSLLT